MPTDKKSLFKKSVAYIGGRQQGYKHFKPEKLAAFDQPIWNSVQDVLPGRGTRDKNLLQKPKHLHCAD